MSAKPVSVQWVDRDYRPDEIRALEAAGVEFISENGGGVGVRLRKPLANILAQPPEGDA